MDTIKKRCPHCSRVNILPYKRRDRPGYCNLKCAYAHRVVHPVIRKVCESCKRRFGTKNAGQMYCSNRCKANGYVGFKHSTATKKLMSRLWTKERRETKTVKRITKVCIQCGGSFIVKGSGRTAKRRLCSEKCQRSRMQTHNPMKRPRLRKLASDLAKNRSKETRAKIANGVSAAWKRGDFEGVKTGRCCWYKHKDWQGRLHNVQGKWELKFAEWMDSERMHYNSHRGWVKYLKDGEVRYWYPDFFVEEWECLVDVKADYFYQPEKFRLVRKHNPGLRFKVLRKAKLKQLGVLP